MNQLNMKRGKKTRKKTLNLTIDVIHGIQKDCDRISWIYDNTINRGMSIFIQQMMLINVPPQSRQTMIPSHT